MGKQEIPDLKPELQSLPKLAGWLVCGRNIRSLPKGFLRRHGEPHSVGEHQTGKGLRQRSFAGSRRPAASGGALASR